MKKILVIDTDSGNLFSLRSALERLEVEVVILKQPNKEQFDGIVIPGQGRFGEVMKNMREQGWDLYLQEMKKTSISIVGICVGMQVFFETSDEDRTQKGLGWLEGNVEALAFPKRPMVGWASLSSQLWPKAQVYFVNSYGVKSSKYSIAETRYGETFCAAIKKENIYGLQFHPEKSSDIGRKILSDCLLSCI